MAEETAGRSYKWILPLLVGIFCGGLGGSVFTWYVNRPKPTVVTYRVATTTLSAPEATGLIPDLKVLIRGNPIQALYADNIELLPRQGPFMDQAEVALSFSSTVHIYGIHTESPSVLHHIECSGLDSKSHSTVRFPDPTTEISDVKCTIGPIQFRGDETRPFRVTIGTNGSDAPRVLIAAKNLELVPADQFSPKSQWDFSVLAWAVGVIGTLAGALSALLFGGFELRRRP